MPKKKATRRIELYVGYSNGSDAGHWGTESVEIPIGTPDDEIAATACAEMERLIGERGDENYAFCGVYNIPDPDEEAEEEA